jgi:hypothetical protein
MPTNKPRVVSNRRFEKKYSDDYGTLFEHVRFNNCCFYNCGLSLWPVSDGAAVADRRSAALSKR